MKNIHGSHNSLEMQLYKQLLESLIEHDCVDLWSSDTNRKRDWEEISNRINCEGFTFITKVLPSLGKAIDKALATGTRFEVPSGFKRKKDTVKPQLLGDPLSRIFDDSGELLPSASERSVAGLRQLCLFFYKLELPYANEDSKRVLDGFVERDASLSHLWDRDFSVDPIYRRARGLIGSVLGSVDPQDIIPRHGTGAVATREDVRGKSNFSRIYASAEKQYPFTEYFRFSVAHTCDTVDEIQELEMLSEPTARVALVPKDSRGPRIISMEPLEIQWLQQGLMTPVVRAIEKHPLTRGHVNFRDQQVNRLLSLEGSVSDESATLDMKEASDSISLPLVRYLFGGTRLLEALEATRSTSTVLPDGRVVYMNKFAPMGSALCFPIESIVFWAISCSVLWTAFGYSKRNAADQVFVYGDDLIVPKKHWDSIAQALSNADLLINQDKCCTATGFRESCGMDAFKGQEVTPVRIKSRFTGALHCWIAAYIEISNLLYRRGYYETASTIEHAIGRELEKSGYSKGIVPYTEKPCGVLSYVRPYASSKFNKVMGVQYRFRKEIAKDKPNYHQLEVRGLRMQPKLLKPTYDGYNELLRSWHQYQFEGESNDYTVTTAAEDLATMLEISESILALTEDIKASIKRHFEAAWEPDMVPCPGRPGWLGSRTDRGSSCCDSKYDRLIASLVSAQSKRTLEWDPRNCLSARGNTYVDKRALKLRRVWTPITEG